MTTFDTLRLDALINSPTNPRKNFNEGRLQELAASIAASGVHQPILARPLPADRLADTAHLKPRPTHEIVAGERRYRASKLAGVATIPVMIRGLTDDQVLEIQIIENLQRDDLTDLEAAEGYRELMHHNSLSADDVGKKIGKSRTYIYNCLKLLALPSSAQEALRNDQIPTSSALLIARIPDAKLQEKALDYAIKPDDNGDLPSYRAFSGWLRANVMLDLSKALFPIDVKTLTTAGSCLDCDKRTGANPDLFTDVKSADMCTYPPCYHLKAEAHKINLDSMVKTIPKEANKNVDLQQGLGLVSTLAQDARAQLQTAEAAKRDIEWLQYHASSEIRAAQRHACYDALIDYIYDCPVEKTASLLPVELLRRWLQQYIEMWNAEDLAVVLDIPPKGDKITYPEYELACRLRIGRADDADIYRYTSAIFLRSDVHSKDTESVLINTFAESLEIDLVPVRQEAADQVQAATKAKIAALNKQIKATKTTSTLPPAGAAIDDAAADAKNKGKNASHAAQARKSKTSTEEAISGIATAMQSLGSEPLEASLGGSEAAAGRNGVAVGTKVEVQFGRHFGKTGTVTHIACENMFDVAIGDGPKATTTRLSGQQFKKVAA